MVLRGPFRKYPHGLRYEAAAGAVHRRISRLRLSEGPEEQKPSYYRAGSGGSGAANLSMGAGGPRQAEHRIYAQQQGNRQSHPVQGGTRLELQPSHQERLRIMEQDHSLAHPPQ